MSVPDRDLLITSIEINSHHGVGILLQRLFPDSTSFVCLRTASLHNGEETFGSAHHALLFRYQNLAETEAQLRNILAPYRIRRILCVPYYREEFVNAVIAKRITGAPLCSFLMDDQNIFTPQVADHLVGELLAATDLCLGISQELCAAYKRKFNCEINLLPPVIDKSDPFLPCYWTAEPGAPLRAAMLGNVWTARRFDQLRGLLRASALEVDWYGNGPQAPWLPGTPEQWEADNIRCMGFYPEEDLVAALASYPFVLVPTGSLGADDDNPSFSRLSLPSRLLFLHATTDTPVLILGSEQTAAGRFVTRLGTGLCSGYDLEELHKRIESLLDPKIRRSLQTNIRRWSKAFVLENAGQWIWDSLRLGKPQPAAFDAAFPAIGPNNTEWINAIRPARPRPIRQLPQENETFREEHAPSFSFSRTRHLSLLAASGLKLPPTSELDLSIFQAAAAHYILRGALPSGGEVLVLGPAIPAQLKNLPATFTLWRISNLEKWQQAGYAGDPSHVVGAASGAAYPAIFPQFDAIVSTSWCSLLGSDPHHLEGLSLYLEACSRSGGINIHFFSAVLNPKSFWTGPAYGYLKKRFLSASQWPDLDELLSADDLFTMSETAYDKFWKPSTKKSYVEAGQPLSLTLYWRKS